MSIIVKLLRRKKAIYPKIIIKFDKDNSLKFYQHFKRSKMKNNTISTAVNFNTNNFEQSYNDKIVKMDLISQLYQMRLQEKEELNKETIDFRTRWNGYIFYSNSFFVIKI